MSSKANAVEQFWPVEEFHASSGEVVGGAWDGGKAVVLGFVAGRGRHTCAMKPGEAWAMVRLLLKALADCGSKDRRLAKVMLSRLGFKGEA